MSVSLRRPAGAWWLAAHASARAFLRNQRGATMAEYALLLGVIALVCVVGARTLGTTLRDRANLAAAYINSL